MSGSLQRLKGMILRHVYVLKASWPRLLELVYWPLVQMVLWGFITRFFLNHSSWVAEAAGVLISAVLLWDTLFRANLGVSYTFVEEMWSRNLAQLFVSPLRPWEMLVSLMGVSAVRTLISVTPAAFLALPFFDVWIFDVGPPLIVFFTNLLITGWTVGLVVVSLVLRFGLGAESLCWLVIFLLAPISGIYYPIASLPDAVQYISWVLPSSYVFEGMRSVLFDGVFRYDLLMGAVGFNLLYMTLAGLLFLRTFTVARRKGLLLQQGE